MSKKSMASRKGVVRKKGAGARSRKPAARKKRPGSRPKKAFAREKTKGGTKARQKRSGAHELLRHRDKVVYVLGAGFSAHAGVPLMGDFLRHSFRLLKGSRGAGQVSAAANARHDDTWETRDRLLAEGLVELLDRYASITSAVRVNLENLEDVFCLVDLPSGIVGRPESENETSDRETLNTVVIRTLCKIQDEYVAKLAGAHDARTTTASTVPQSYLSRQFNTALKENEGYEPPQERCPYESFVSHVLRSHKDRKVRREDDLYDLDAVITLNYDLLVEDALNRLFSNARIYYGGGILDPESRESRKDGPWKDVVTDCNDIRKNEGGAVFPIIKMHGSINWLCRSRTEKEGGAESPSDGFRHVWEVRTPCETNSVQDIQASMVPLVPPTWRRQLSAESLFAKLVSEAIRHLRHAAKIVIIGYSMPDTDKHFRYVLARGLQTTELPDIEVWDVKPEEEMMANLANIFDPCMFTRNRVRYSDQGFHGFLGDCAQAGWP